MHTLQFRAMGCQMLAMIDTESPEAVEALTRAPGWFEAWEASLSRFRADSELMRLNGAPGTPFAASDVLWEVLSVALVAEAESEGLVTPLVLDSLEAAGYALSFEWLKDKAQPVGALRPQVTAQQRALTLSEVLRFDPEHQTITLSRGARLDLGGVAKGWAAEEAARRLSAFGPALVDAGGDIAVSGPRADGSAWTIAVADPQLEGGDLGRIEVERGGVATSGRDYRRWQVDGQWRHHLIDPRTGEPSLTDVLSATVIAPTLRQAETAAKTIFLLGSHDAWSWLADRPDLRALLVVEDGRMLTAPNAGWLKVT